MLPLLLLMLPNAFCQLQDYDQVSSVITLSAINSIVQRPGVRHQPRMFPLWRPVHLHPPGPGKITLGRASYQVLMNMFQVCDGILDCPLGETSDGGEDENVCTFASGDGDYPDNPPSTFFELDSNGALNFEDFVDVGREIPGIDNFVQVETSPGPPNFQDVGTEPTFSNVQEDLPPSIIPEPVPSGDSSVSVEDMCHIQEGKSNIVLDMFESFGDDFSQMTNPVELPVMGTVGRDINLELVFPSGNSIFRYVISFS